MASTSGYIEMRRRGRAFAQIFCLSSRGSLEKQVNILIIVNFAYYPNVSKAYSLVYIYRKREREEEGGSFRVLYALNVAYT